MDSSSNQASFVQVGLLTGPSTVTLVSAFVETVFDILTGTIPKWVLFEQDSCLIS